MNISVFGLGYVGCVTAACLAREGNRVIGVDVNPLKVQIINDGKSPIVEKDIDKIIYETVNQSTPEGNPALSATTDPFEAVKETEISLICVGTPSNYNGSIKLDYIKNCFTQIAEVLKDKPSYHVIVLRSTVLPGTLESMIKLVEEVSGKKAGTDFGAVMNPEFLRESTSVYDFYHPPVTVIGELDQRSGDAVAEIYSFLDAPVVRTDIKTAEMVKYTCNAFHALKVTFANEIGRICKALNIDSHQVMDIFCMDKKLNISTYYLKPGFAFGGSCLPKDLRAITYKARTLDVKVPLLDTILQSNRIHIEDTIDRIIRTGKKKIGVLGLSFKAGTDDLRESPMVILVETLIGKGFNIKIYDRNVSLARLFGANKEYIEKEIPHISSLMTNSMEELIQHSDIIVIGNNDEEFKKALSMRRNGQIVYDLVRVKDEQIYTENGYEGICW